MIVALMSLSMPIALLGLASFTSWFISMLAGGGSPFILIPLVNFWYGAESVAPVITTGMMLGNMQRIGLFWQHVNWTVTRWYAPGALVGAILGAYAFTKIQLEWMQILLGIALLLVGVNHWLGRTKPVVSVKAWQFLPIGFLYAFGSGLVGSTGPVMNPVYLNYGLVKEEMIATKSVNVVMVHIVKLITYWLLGALHPMYLLYGVVIGVAALPANWLGKIILDRMSGDQFQQAVLTFVALSGAFMVWNQRHLLLWF